MNTIGTTPTVDWLALLDELKGKEGIGSDAKLAALLGVSRGYICSVRKGRKRLSLELAQTILLRLGRAFETTSLKQLSLPTKVQQHLRLLDTIRELVLQRARGHCELCGLPAPFIDADGKPYLEVHHVASPQNGGSSTADNLVALCPNCHSKMRVNATTAEEKKLQALAAKYKEHQSKFEDDDPQ